MSIGLPKFNTNIFKSNAVENGTSRALTPPNHVRMAIVPTNEPSNPLLTTLLLNPDSITETKSANWIKHNVPGQSDPLMQWVNGSERTVTFTAKVTLDLLENITIDWGNEDYWTLEIEPELNQIREITASYNATILDQLSAVSPRDPQQLVDGNTIDNTQERWRQSIQPNLDFYRGLLLPRTGSRPNEVRTPPLVRLFMGNILGAESYSANQDFILASYNFNITQCTPQLLPTCADVTFTFIEYNDQSKALTPREARTVGDYNRQTELQLEANEQARRESIFNASSPSIPQGGASTGFNITPGG